MLSCSFVHVFSVKEFPQLPCVYVFIEIMRLMAPNINNSSKLGTKAGPLFKEVCFDVCIVLEIMQVCTHIYTEEVEVSYYLNN